MHSPIILVAINARYSHSSLGARSLLANMEDALRRKTRLMEFNINDPAERIAEAIAPVRPDVLGLGVYIWNRLLVERLIPLLQQALPGTSIVMGGPEITFDCQSPLAQAATCVVRGEGEALWPTLCRDLLEGRPVNGPNVLQPPDLKTLALPDREYGDEDLRHRNIYIETSRGCPLACDFCLSASESGVRHYDEAAVHAALQRLLDRGALQFRFVDRSFNLGGPPSERLLQFFLERQRPGLRLHFEITPDGLRAQRFRKLLQGFGPGTLHLEAGIQSFNPEVLQRIHRPSDVEAAAAGMDWLVNTVGTEIHADLIAGLPGETPESFANGFDRLYRLGPSEIQVGVLKRLHGSPLAAYASRINLRFRDEPPYDVLQTDGMTEEDLEAIRRFAAHWDRVFNRQRFPGTVRQWLADAPSPWKRFDAFSLRLAGRYGLYGIPMLDLARELLDELTQKQGMDAEAARRLLRKDYLGNGQRQRLPAFLRPVVPIGR